MKARRAEKGKEAACSENIMAKIKFMSQKRNTYVIILFGVKIIIALNSCSDIFKQCVFKKE